MCPPQAYDYAGSWLTYADNQANLYGGVRTGVSTDAAVQWYTANGASAGKINLGKLVSSNRFRLLINFQVCPCTAVLSRAPTASASHTAGCVL